MRKTKLFSFLFCLAISLSYFSNVYCADENITITTYYPSPNGSYRDLSVSNRMAIGNVDASVDGKVDINDMAVYGSNDTPSLAGDPIPGSLTIASRLGIGTVTPNAALTVKGGISHDARNKLYGSADTVATHVNLGVSFTNSQSVTGQVGKEKMLCTIGGGGKNEATEVGATVAGGYQNKASGLYSAVAGGYGNEASVEGSTIGGGSSNKASVEKYSTVSGGLSNTANGQFSTVAGGQGDKATGKGSVVSGGENNTASGETSTISGGLGNTASGKFSTIAGGDTNKATGEGTTVAGGVNNNNSDSNYTTISGGKDNVIRKQGTKENSFATIAGGLGNSAVGIGATVSGGINNSANTGIGGSGVDSVATVSGGKDNSANQVGATVSGGENNTISGNYSTISGGKDNNVSGYFSVIPGGSGNTVSKDGSWAGGRKANAMHEGSFIWSNGRDASGYFVDRKTNGDNTFNIYALAGVYVGGAKVWDVAEFMSFKKDDPVGEGDLVSLIGNDLLGRSSSPYDNNLVGVISSKKTSSLHLGSTEAEDKDKKNMPVALVGRCYIKVCPEGGSIAIGDPITSSSLPGVGMKALKAGKIIGYAMESAQFEKKENQEILVFVSLGYYLPKNILEKLNNNP